MNIDRAVFAFAGVNMFQAAFTAFCPGAAVFRRPGLPAGNAFT